MIDVIIPTYGKPHILRNIHRQFSKSADADALNVVFVLRNDDSESLSICESSGFKYVVNFGKQSLAEDYGYGIAASSGEWVLLANDRIVVPREPWVHSLVSHLPVVGAQVPYPEVLLVRRSYLSETPFNKQYEYHFFLAEFVLTAKLAGVYTAPTTWPLPVTHAEPWSDRAVSVYDKDKELFLYRAAQLVAASISDQ